MGQQTIGLGTADNDGTGDSLKVGGDKINDNFDELYNIANGYVAEGGALGGPGPQLFAGSDDHVPAVWTLEDLIAYARAQVAPNRQLFTPTSGGTVTIAASNRSVIEVYLNHTASITGLTVNFPTLLDGQRLFILWRETASSITLTPANGTLLGAFGNVGTANARSAWVYNDATGNLHRYA
jgi:hypothetical protein